MGKLLKNDLYRATKDKSLYVAIVIFVAYAILIALLNKQIPGSLLNGKTTFKTSYSVMGDFGMLLPIFITTYVVKDFRYHTVKNKIIMGHPKWQVYLSSLLSAFIVGSILVIFTSFVSLGMGCVLTEYGPYTSIGGEIGFAVVYMLLSLLLLFITLSIIFMVTVLTGSTGLGIACALVLSFLFPVLVILPSFVNMPEAVTNILSFTNYYQSLELVNCNIFGDLTVSQEGIWLNLLTRILIFTPIFLGGLNALGIYLFHRKEQK